MLLGEKQLSGQRGIERELMPGLPPPLIALFDVVGCNGNGESGEEHWVLSATLYRPLSTISSARERRGAGEEWAAEQVLGFCF